MARGASHSCSLFPACFLWGRSLHFSAAFASGKLTIFLKIALILSTGNRKELLVQRLCSACGLAGSWASLAFGDSFLKSEPSPSALPFPAPLIPAGGSDQSRHAAQVPARSPPPRREPAARGALPVPAGEGG